MKGVILAGGSGSRLSPLTKITNKHLLPIYDKPMVFYPLQTLVSAGITEILIVTGGVYAGEFLRLLGNGSEFGLKRLHYAYQEGEGGIAAALKLAEDFADKERLVVMLGDNIIEDTITRFVRAYQRQKRGAKILLKSVPHPERFGCPEIKNGKILRIIEKPKVPPSNFAVVGIYFYDHQVFDIIKRLKPSARGELEITDVNNWYLKKGQLTYDILEGWWTDAGTFDSLLAANNLVAAKRKECKE